MLHSKVLWACAVTLVAGSTASLALQPANQPDRYPDQQRDRNQPGDRQPARDQDRNDPRDRDMNRDQTRMDDGERSSYVNARPVFRSADALIGTDVTNANDDTVSTINDFIVDRGSGRVRFVVVKSGGVLGLGGKTVAVPFSAFTWPGTEKHPRLNYATEDLKSWTEFNKSDWANGGRRDAWLEGGMGRNDWYDNRDRNRINDNDANYNNPGNDVYKHNDRNNEYNDRHKNPEHNDNNYTDPNRTTNDQPGTDAGDRNRTRNNNENTVNRDDDRYGRRGPTTSPDTAGSPTREVVGTIQSFQRQSDPRGREELIVTIRSDDGTSQDVVLGPSWFLAGNNSIAFYRSSPIKVKVFSFDEAGKPRLVATTADINGKSIDFYGSSGRAQWATNPDRSADEYSGGSPYLLYSDLDGKDVDCRGVDCGSVEDVLVDTAGRRFAFLVIDPDANFLGIGDTNRLVPWGIMTSSLNDAKVHMDATKEMITAAPERPDDLTAFSMGSQPDSVYQTFGIDPPTARQRR